MRTLLFDASQFRHSIGGKPEGLIAPVHVVVSVAAKTFFVLSEMGKPATAKELSESAKKLGWDPKPREIDESIGFLGNLGLATKKAR